MNLNICEWKEFKVGNLFDIHPTKALDGVTAEDCNEFGITPLVVNQSYDNGIAGKVNYEATEKGGIITFSDTWEGETFFYQKDDFIGFAHVQGMYPREKMSENSLIFISVMLEYEARDRYSYGRKKRRDLISESYIKLPVTKDGNPNWDYMDKYVKSLHHKPLTTQNKKLLSLKLNVQCWKAFKTSKLFYNLQNGKANQQLLKEGNDCFYVGAKKDENGVMIHCMRDEHLITKGNCIVFICNGQGSVGYANYMDVDFIGTTDIVAGYNKHLNEPIGIFLATVYSQERPKYSFGRKWKTHLADTEVKLPILHDANGAPVIDDSHEYSDEGFVPDWHFMEHYIKSLPYGDRLES